MSTISYIFGSIYILLSLIIIAFVLLQQSKSANLPGTISGGADTFFGKNRGRSLDAKLGRLTTILSFVFIVLTIVLNIVS